MIWFVSIPKTIAPNAVSLDQVGEWCQVIIMKICWSCAIPFSAHVRKLIGFLLAVKSGLYQIGVYLDGARGEFVIWWNFHQAVRAAAIVGILKQWCFLIVWL